MLKHVRAYPPEHPLQRALRALVDGNDVEALKLLDEGLGLGGLGVGALATATVPGQDAKPGQADDPFWSKEYIDCARRLMRWDKLSQHIEKSARSYQSCVSMKPEDCDVDMDPDHSLHAYLLENPSKLRWWMFAQWRGAQLGWVDKSKWVDPITFKGCERARAAWRYVTQHASSGLIGEIRGALPVELGALSFEDEQWPECSQFIQDGMDHVLQHWASAASHLGLAHASVAAPLHSLVELEEAVGFIKLTSRGAITEVADSYRQLLRQWQKRAPHGPPPRLLEQWCSVLAGRHVFAKQMGLAFDRCKDECNASAATLNAALAGDLSTEAPVSGVRGSADKMLYESFLAASEGTRDIRIYKVRIQALLMSCFVTVMAMLRACALQPAGLAAIS